MTQSNSHLSPAMKRWQRDENARIFRMVLQHFSSSSTSQVNSCAKWVSSFEKYFFLRKNSCWQLSLLSLSDCFERDMIQRERVNYCGLINHCLTGDLKKRFSSRTYFCRQSSLLCLSDKKYAPSSQPFIKTQGKCSKHSYLHSSIISIPHCHIIWITQKF